MFCYNCGCHLSEHDFCTACGADVSLYKEIMVVSNLFYNEGLEKARVRDLTGAINSLRQSIKFNKNNIAARNLLGLVYFETGEVIAASGEWVISKNLCPEQNIADDYIQMIQSNRQRWDSLNQTIKKYNQALAYCRGDNKDLAVIQLRKVLSMNAKFVHAHQLMALIHMDNGQWDKAQRELKKCQDIDCNNTTTLRYMQEVKRMLSPEENDKAGRKQKKEDTVRYQSGNEVIIQPLNVKEPKRSGVSTLVNVGIGLLIGLAAMYYLVVPAAVSDANNEAKKTITEIGNQLDARTSRIQELETQVDSLEKEKEALYQEINGYVGEGGTLSNMDALLTAVTEYLDTQDIQKTAANLENMAQGVEMQNMSEPFRNLYQTLLATIGPELAEECHTAGYTAYRNEDYPTAIENLSKAVQYDAENGTFLYDLANAYRKSGDVQNAIVTYDKVIERFPDTEMAAKAKRYREELTAAENAE